MISGGADKAVRLWDLENVANTVHQLIGSHDAPVKAVGFASTTNLAISGSWDRTVKLWDARMSKPVSILVMPERVYAMSFVLAAFLLSAPPTRNFSGTMFQPRHRVRLATRNPRSLP